MRRRRFLAAVAAGAAAAGCTSGGGTPTPVGTDTVVIPDAWVFEPEVVRVSTGTTVAWRNDGGQDHTVTFRDDEPIEVDVVFAPGERVTHTFERAGTFDYYCRFHTPDMVGTVIVEG